MTRVVLDTNVWLSALLFPRGTCDQLLKALRSRRVSLWTSAVLLEEARGILCHKFDHTAHEAERVIDTIRAMATLIEPTERLDVVKRDPPDNRVLECAVAAQADRIISGDTRDLQPLGAFRGIPIVSPRAALDELV